MRLLTLSVLIGALTACSPAQEASAPSPQSHGPSHDMSAHSAPQGDLLLVTNAVIRPPLPGRTTAMGTLHIKNMSGKDDVLIAASVALPGTTEIHTMLNEEGVMKMRRVENGLPIKAGQTLTLKGGADHLMVFNTEIAADMKTVPLTLTFEHAGALQITAYIDDGSNTGSGDMDHSGH